MQPSQLKNSEIVFISIYYKSIYFNNLINYLFSLEKNESHLFRYFTVLSTDNLSYQCTLIDTLYFTLCLDERLPKSHLWMDLITLPVCKNQHI